MKATVAPPTPHEYWACRWAASRTWSISTSCRHGKHKADIAAFPCNHLRDHQRQHNILAEESVQSASELKVLVVEDHTISREMLRTLCRQCEVPIDCTVVATGVEALIDIAIIMPDLLIADLNMPGVNGFLLLRTLCPSPQFSHMTTLVLSSLTTKEIEDRGGLPDGDICIAKPVQAQWVTGFFAALMAGRLNKCYRCQGMGWLRAGPGDSGFVTQDPTEKPIKKTRPEARFLLWRSGRDSNPRPPA